MVLAFLIMVIRLTLIRARSVSRADGWQPRVSAILGTYLFPVGLAFLAPRDDLSLSLLVLSASLIFIGNMFCVYCLAQLGRSFSIMAEARQLVTHGPYSIIRHPLYLAEAIVYLGVFMQYASLSAAILLLLQFGFQVIRMINEEALLGTTFPGYVDYMQRTKRLVPGFW
jgi:protein-S-isoprenylcysteine O-methyltransferase Ste14